MNGVLMADMITEYLKKESPVFDKEIEKVVPKNAEPWEVYGLIWEHLELGGKKLRPVMCKLSCEAVGGNGKKTIPAGAAIEMFHNFTLIHDDIMDESELRRGKPCLYKKYGVPLAINAGDGLFMKVSDEILRIELPPEKVMEIQKTLNAAFTRVLEGQAIELNWYRQKKFDVTEEDYKRMIGGKTGALISASCEVGAMIGSGNEEQKKALRDFGMAVGLSFQLQDDVLNLVGEEKTYKKEIGGDISEGKRTLMVIYALAKAEQEDKKRLVEILSKNTKDKKEISTAIEIMKKYGAIEQVKAEAIRIVEEAKKGLMILPNNEASRKLLELADFFIYREV